MVFSSLIFHFLFISIFFAYGLLYFCFFFIIFGHFSIRYFAFSFPSCYACRHSSYGGVYFDAAYDAVCRTPADDAIVL